MKKTLLVAALATGFAGVAHAETSVTLYGLVDAGLGYSEKKVTTDAGSGKSRSIGAVSNIKNGSRWGLKGTEDLGNGTSAIFQLESGFDPADGTSAQGGRLFGRKALIGLTGESWGTFTIGRQDNATDEIMSGLDPFGTGWGNAAANSTFGKSLSARQDALLKYVSPSFDGFKFAVSFGYNDTKVNGYEYLNDDNYTRTYDSKDRSTTVSASLGYANGPLELGASFDYDRKREDNLTTGTRVLGSERLAKAWTVGAAYDFDVVKLHLGYGQQRDGVINGDFGLAGGLFTGDEQLDLDTRGLRTQAWFGGVSAPLGESSKIIAGYQGGRIKHNGSEFEGERINTHVWSLGFQQNLSKRTHVYVLGSYGQSKLKSEAGNEKARYTQAVVGLQHRF